MNIQRFHAPTAREALTQARQTFGEGTLILSNRPTATGVEVVATGEDSLAHMGSAAARSPQAASKETLKNPADKDTEDMAMSTLSFQSYVRERMLRRRKEEASGQASSQPKAQRSQADPAARAAQAGLMTLLNHFRKAAHTRASWGVLRATRQTKKRASMLSSRVITNKVKPTSINAWECNFVTASANSFAIILAMV